MDINKVLEQLDTLDYTKTETFLTDMLEQARTEQDNQTELSLLNEMIGFCRDTCQYEKARQYADEIMQLLQRMNLQGTLGYATSLLNIANAERASGELEESLKHYREVYHIYEKLLKPDDFLFASLNNNLSLLYQEKKDFQSSCECLKKALRIAEQTPDCEIETATTCTNLSQSLLCMEQIEEAETYICRALMIFAADGNRDYHYSAALSVYAQICFLKGDYQEAADHFEKSMQEFEKHMGRGGNYEILKENRDRALEMLGKEKKAGINRNSTKTSCRENGLQLCKAYFEEFGMPMLREQFPQYMDRIAAGLCGEGSECFGFDDEFSKDHDWGPGFCLWIPEDIKDRIGEDLQKAYENLPKSYHGYKRNTTKEGKIRTGVWTISGFYSYFLNGTIPKTEQEWLACEEEALAAVTNGEVFFDGSGEFSRIRNRIKEYYPKGVQRKRLGRELILMAQTGQYNFPRMLKRSDKVTAQMYLSQFMTHTLRVLYLLNSTYAPYTKWLHKGAGDLFVLPEITDILNAIADMAIEDTNIPLTIEIIAQLIVEELINQKWIAEKTETDMFYLESYGKILLQREESETMENTHEKLVEELVLAEWNAFDKVKNEGGRASCQDDWGTFSIMRKSQYLEWTDEMLQSYLRDFAKADAKGWNLITEKYGRMMESTAPDKYEEIKDSLPPLSDRKKAIMEEIVKIQVGFMEELALQYPKVAGTARSIHTSEDTLYNTSYETYLRGELGTYSDETLALYGSYIVSLVNKKENLAKNIMRNTAILYGYASLEDLENRI